MANLAIKGHPTRGNEVIELLEMLGGKNSYGGGYKSGFAQHYAYFINTDENSFIDGFLLCDETSTEFSIFALEEFLKKFPYKIGDKAFAFDNKCTIIDAVWDEGIDEVVYTIKLDTSKYTTTKLSNQLQPYKEETMEDIIKIDIPKGYEFAGVDDDKQQVVFEKIGYHYPKTYEECCDVLKIKYPYFKTEEDGISASTYKNELFGNLKQLLICRDAYWKIAGEQLGLGKPWEPDWSTEYETEYVIEVYRNKVRINSQGYSNTILAFPTAEMRDAFQENFWVLIELCKELL